MTPLTSILLAIFLFPLLFLLHIGFVQFMRTGEKAIRCMFVAFIAYALLWCAAIFYFNEWRWIHLNACLAGFAIVIFLCLGYMEFFSMAARGFSLRIMTDIYLHQQLTLEQIIKNYGNKGMDWMMEKRINTMAVLGLVQIKNDHLKIKNSYGKIIGKTGLIVKKVLKMGEGG